MMNGMSRAADRARRDLGISVVFIMCFLRERSQESALTTLALAEPYKDLIIGVGLDGDASESPPSRFSDVFQQAKLQGFHTTAHCDIVPDKSIEHIREALIDMQLDRLDHASCLLDDPEIARLAVKKRIVVTCCPETELLFYGDRGASKMRRFLQAGVRCTMNSDDPGYFDAHLDEVVSRTLDEGVRLSEVVDMFRYSIEGSWMNDTRKQGLLRDFDRILVKHTVPVNQACG